MKDYLVDVLNFRQKALLRLFIFLWMLCVGAFWVWWCMPSHYTDSVRFTINTLILGWNTLLPGYYFYFLNRMKKPNPKLQISKNVRVAMVVTRAPSEPFDLIKKNLGAMKAQAFPHDTWLADEDPTPKIQAWCKANDVSISSRKGHPDYHQTEWPRREKCKEGNLAYFYDLYGYDRYDIVVQMDSDHIPEMGYLEEMVRPFVNPEVGYVSAPSICDTNASKSWTARGRLFSEGTFHGTLQAGYSNGWAPLCIGSHYAVRTQALKEIGGLGPELAEDHSTSFMMNVHGWKGVHAIDAEAHGDGPATFTDGMVQEFQWSRSLIMLLCSITPRNLKQLPFRLKFQFVFAQLWYPIFAIVMLVSCLIPIVALLTELPWVNVMYFAFLMYSFLPIFSALIIVIFVSKQKWLRPYSAKVISWEAALFQLARWPWVVQATIDGIQGSLLKKKFTWRVTPKGAVDISAISYKMIFPYILVCGISGLALVMSVGHENIRGYYWFALMQWLVYVLLVVVIVYRHVQESK